MPTPLTKRVRYIQHQGKEVLEVDTSHCNREALEATLKAYFELLHELPVGSKVRVLMDYSGVEHDAQMANLGKSELAVLNAHVFRSAVLGMSELNAIATQGYIQAAEFVGQPIGPDRAMKFNDRDLALDWLTA